MDPQIIDRIYECLFLPGLWLSVLGELAEIASTHTGFLFVSNGSIHDRAASTEIGIEAVNLWFGTEVSRALRDFAGSLPPGIMGS